MSYLGDYTDDYATLHFKFTTRTTAGVPATLAGTPVISIYKGGTVAPFASSGDAEVTLSVDYNSITGLNNVLIDLSGDANFAAGNDYSVVITTGTVNSVSVVGETVANFSIENRWMEADATKIGGSTTAASNLKSILTGNGIADDVDIEFRSLIVQDDTGAPVQFISASSGSAGLSISGLGSGAGIEASGGTSGPGVLYAAGGGNKAGMELLKDGTGKDIDAGEIDNTLIKLDRNMDVVESQRGEHTGQGSVFYCDFDNGNDSSGEGTKALPYKTLQAVHDDLVTSGAHDIVIMVASGTGTTTHTSTSATQLSKRYMFVRGPGRDLIFTRSTNGDTIEITGDGVEISGMQIGTHSEGSGDGISITAADFVKVKDCWILDTRGDGIRIVNSTNCRVLDNHFKGTGVTGGGQAVHVSGTGGSSNDTIISRNHFADTDGTAVLIEQATTNDTEIHHNTFHNSGAGGSGWGLDITSSSTNAQVHHNVFGNNADGDIRDNGTTTVKKNNEQWLSSTTEGRTLDVTAAGNAGIDWGNIENKATGNALSQTDIRLVATTTTNSDMRGTNSAALASVVGALNDAAAAGIPTDADTVMQYVKQIVNLAGDVAVGIGYLDSTKIVTVNADLVVGGELINLATTAWKATLQNSVGATVAGGIDDADATTVNDSVARWTSGTLTGNLSAGTVYRVKVVATYNSITYTGIGKLTTGDAS